jgi:hypothetical protein
MKSSLSDLGSLSHTKRVEDAERLGMLGMSNDQLAWWFGVTRAIVDVWIAEDEMFGAALNKGRANVIEKLSNKCIELALDGDTKAMKMALSHIARWKMSGDTVVENMNILNVQSERMMEAIPTEKLAGLLREAREGQSDADTDA